MILKYSKVLALALLLSGALTWQGAFQAEAKPYKQRVNNRQHRQDHRLASGLRSGELTRREAKNLLDQQRKLARKEAQMRASGNGLTKAEAVRLEARQDAMSANIYKQKNDSQDRN